MKAAILTSALLIATLAFAGNPNRARAQQSLICTQIQMVDNEVLEIRLDNPLAKELEVEVRSAEGVLIMKRKLRDLNEYTGRYEFAKLTKGQYNFNILLEDVLIDQKTVEVH